MQLQLIKVPLFQSICKQCLDKFSYYKSYLASGLEACPFPTIPWKWSNIKNLDLTEQ